MQEDRIRCVISGIRRFQLTTAEAEFIAFAERNLNQDGPLMKKIDLILEGIYRQKTKFIRDSIVSMLMTEENRFRSSSTDRKVHFLNGRF